jgi:hypothetical protein
MYSSVHTLLGGLWGMGRLGGMGGWVDGGMGRLGMGVLAPYVLQQVDFAPAGRLCYDR